MPRMSEDRQRKIRQIVLDQGRRIEARARTRKLQFVFLLLCGGGLLVLGLSKGLTFGTVCGVVFILYVLLMWIYVHRPNVLVDELRREMGKAIKAMDDEDCENGSTPQRKGRNTP